MDILDKNVEFYVDLSPNKSGTDFQLFIPDNIALISI